MISLFDVVDQVPQPTEEAMMHACVQGIMELKYNKQPGDSQGRERKRGIAELCFVYFYTDYRSMYNEYPQEERMKAALTAAGLPEDYKISDKLQKVVDWMLDNRDKSRKLRILESARHAVDQLTEYFRKSC